APAHRPRTRSHGTTPAAHPRRADQPPGRAHHRTAHAEPRRAALGARGAPDHPRPARRDERRPDPRDARRPPCRRHGLARAGAAGLMPAPAWYPTPEQELLLRAALLDRGPAERAWVRWRTRHGENRALGLLSSEGMRLEQPRAEVDLRARHGETLLTRDDHRVDLHWALLWQPGPDDEFWDAAVPIELRGVATRTLCATDHVLHVCAHG